jgi:hypothetical protein
MTRQELQSMCKLHFNFAVENVRNELEGEFQVNPAIQVELLP